MILKFLIFAKLILLEAKFTNVLGKVCVISNCVFAIPFVKLIDTKVITRHFTAVFVYQSQISMRVLKNLNCIILMHFNLNMLKSCTSTVTWPRLQCKHVLKHYFNRSQKYPHLIMFKMSNRLARLLSIVVACTYIHVVAIFSCIWLTDLCIFSIPWQHISLS